jgi:hypothetical protein
MFIIMFSSLPCQVVAVLQKKITPKQWFVKRRRMGEGGMRKGECERGKAERAKHKGF